MMLKLCSILIFTLILSSCNRSDSKSEYHEASGTASKGLMDGVYQGVDGSELLTMDFRPKGRVYIKSENALSAAIMKKNFNTTVSSKWDSATYAVENGTILVSANGREITLEIGDGYIALGPFRLKRIE